MSFKDALDSIKDGIKDLSQLNVRTFSGELTANVDSLPGKEVRLPEFLRAATIEGSIDVVGFTDIDEQGREGLELAFNDWLTGRDGAKRVVRDRLGRIIEIHQFDNANVIVAADHRR